MVKKGPEDQTKEKRAVKTRNITLTVNSKQRNEIFVLRKRPIRVYIKEMSKLIAQEFKKVEVKGTGACIPKVIKIVNEFTKKSVGLKFDVKTEGYSVQALREIVCSGESGGEEKPQEGDLIPVDIPGICVTLQRK